MSSAPNPHDLDEAIDRVAAALVEVPADDTEGTRVLARLAASSAPYRSVPAWRLAGAAAASVVVAAGLIYAVAWRRDGGEPMAPPSAALVAATERSPESEPVAPAPRAGRFEMPPRSGGPVARSIRAEALRLPDDGMALPPLAGTDVIEVAPIGRLDGPHGTGLVPLPVDALALAPLWDASPGN